MLLWQILALILFFGLILIAVLAFIEPGPLNRRSRTKRGQKPEDAGAHNPDRPR
jgi:hypothetical protein